MAESRSRSLFSDMVGRPDEAVDLAQAALLIACEEYADLDIARYLHRLDDMGSAARERLSPGAPPEESVATLNRYLFREQGFRGNTREYHDPRNSYLNEVLDRRTGIPISLSAVYMEVAHRAGLRVEGVGLPGHFIVKVAGASGDILIDPFHQGAILSSEDCQKRLDRVYGGRIRMEGAMLAACERKEILARMLRNLKAIYLKAEDHARALGIVDLLLRVSPESGEDLRDRGLLYAAMDCYHLAVRDLEAYLTLVPGTPESGDILDRIVEMRQKAARLN